MIELDTKSEGLSEMAKEMQKLRGMGAAINSAEIPQVPRQVVSGIPVDRQNLEIIRSLQETGRDFFKLEPGDEQAAATAFADRVHLMIQSAEAKGADMKADAYMSRGLLEALRVIGKRIGDRIESQRVSGGGEPAPNSPGYAAWKRAKTGSTKVGILTGQLLDNMISGVVKYFKG